MSLVRYEPWRLFNQFHGDINRLFADSGDRRPQAGERVAASNWVPAVDIREDEDRFVIHADVPGVDAESIEVHMEDGVLSIKGERDAGRSEDRKGYKRMERAHGAFLRRFSMPDTVDAGAISARAKDGVLEIVIPKQEKLQPRRIRVEG